MVNVMKRYIVSLLIILFISLIINKKENILLVFDETSEYAMYILEFPNQNISTNNIDLFNNIKIIWIKPYINNLYKSKLNYKVYYFEDVSLKENVNKFKNQYINLLYIKGYKQDALNLKISGIKIEKMKVYCEEKDIENINIDNMQIKRVES